MLKDIDGLLLSPEFLRQRRYWENHFAVVDGDPFPCTQLGISAREGGEEKRQPAMEKMAVIIPEAVCQQLIRFSKRSDLSLYILLHTLLKVLIYRYTGNEEPTVLSPVLPGNSAGLALNQWVLVRDRLRGEMTFIQFLLRVRQSLLEAYENQDYPVERLMASLFPGSTAKPANSKATEGPFFAGISNVVCISGNLHPRELVQSIGEGFLFYFNREDQEVGGFIQYDPARYDQMNTWRISRHFSTLAAQALENINARIDLFPGEGGAGATAFCF